MCGVAFSGKSTLAKKIAEDKKAALVSQDNIWFAKREELNLDLDSDDDWERIQQLSREKIKELLIGGSSIVYDDISLKYANRELLRTLAKESAAEAILVYLDTPRDIQRERQAKNLQAGDRHDVPDHLIEWGLAELEIPQENENPFIFTPDTNTAEWLKLLP